jgi:RNA polymerase sigma factor (sigma-70 family)
VDRPLGTHDLGTLNDELRFLGELQTREPAAVKRLVDQLRQDVASDQDRGLVLLSKAYRSRIVGWLNKTYFAGDYERAQEAWNDTLLRVWQRVGSYDETRMGFISWVFSQARYAAQDLLRAIKVGRETAFAPDEEGDEKTAFEREMEAEARRGFEETQPLTRREEAALRRARARLNSTQRQLLDLRYVLGLEPVEIARGDLLDRAIPETHIRVYINRAAQRLRRLYEQELAESTQEGDEADA